MSFIEKIEVDPARRGDAQARPAPHRPGQRRAQLPARRGVTRIVDAIVAVGTETTVTHYVSVRCGKCRTEFNTSANFRTAACKRCGRVCRLDLADRIPDALPSNVTPIRRLA